MFSFDSYLCAWSYLLKKGKFLKLLVLCFLIIPLTLKKAKRLIFRKKKAQIFTPSVFSENADNTFNNKNNKQMLILWSFLAVSLTLQI